MIKASSFFYLTLLFVLILISDVNAQLEIRTNTPSRSSVSSNTVPYFRTQEDDPLLVPFWDDFSGYEGRPDTNLWMESENVLINRTMGINPVSLGVATLDGMTGNGRPYSANEVDQGIADVLMSRPINLIDIPEENRNTVFLSFFWQIKGKGEMPNDEEGDAISLQFRNGEEWVEVWNPQSSYTRLNVTGYYQLKTDTFYRENIQIPANYFTQDFQFRFQTTGRLSGPFDSWNLDYIFLHLNKNANANYTFDRTLTKIPNSIFKHYHAIPFKHFSNNIEKYSGSSSAEAFNLDAYPQAVRFTVSVYDTLAADKTPVILKDSSFVIKSYERVTLPGAAIDFNSLNFQADSAYLKTEYTFYTGDNYAIKSISATDTTYYQHVDFRSNDTTSTLNVLHNYYAYDDGTAEFNAGISQQHGKLAYEFVTSERDTIKSIRIHFPVISPSSSGRTFELTVWDEIGETETVLTKRSIEVQSSGDNSFVEYDIVPAIIVTDTFFIGWTQTSGGYLGVGLDKNTNSGDKIWFNVEGTWINNTRVEGSLMIRPVFGRGEITTSIESEPVTTVIENKIVVYPNPADGTFYVRGVFDKLKVYDLRGIEIKPFVSINDDGSGLINLTGFPPGIYIVNFYYKDTVQRIKIINK